ncbi:hypothetical protein MRS44_012174 [Fusarium solani]|uniref:uncharacterized protein n=1 Tax=Fusarium solani TaxID=169388 RepID=UPI0032C48933|nr:hypothetical protein MRS44_012174 [Fusarium solani]
MADPDTVMTDGSASTTLDPATAGSPIQKIPLEVLLRITHFLTTPELGKVRLLCRSMEQALYTSFTNEFFTRKQFMISEESLQALIDISKSRLSRHLRKVHIGLDRFPQLPHIRGNDPQSLRLAEHYIGQFTLLSNGYHREMLAEAFRNLKHLEDVVFRDFNSTRRTRDGPYRQWTSYGSTTAFNETGTRPNQTTWGPETTVAYGSTVFSSVLFALGQAGARPKGIEYMSRSRNHLRDLAFNLPSYMEASVFPVLNNLEKLHLDVYLTGDDGFLAYPSAAFSDASLRRFLLQVTNVKHLRINETQGSDTGPGALLGWLGQTSNPSTSGASVNPATSAPSVPSGVPPTPPPSFPLLEELNLGMMSVSPSRVLEALAKFAPTLQRSSPKVSFWTKFLERLKDVPSLDLHHIKISCPQQQWLSRPAKSPVNFQADNKNAMEYTGPDWKHFVGEMIPKVVVHYTPDEGDPDSDSDDGSHDEDEEDDEEDEDEDET